MELEFKVGDLVHRAGDPDETGKITDKDSSSLPFEVTWDEDEEVEWCEADELEHHGSPEVGDIVLIKAKVVVDDHSSVPYKVKVSDDGDSLWLREGDILEIIERAPKPEPETVRKFKVDDKVIHVNKPEWGVGKVTAVYSDSDRVETCDWMTPTERKNNVLTHYAVRFPHQGGTGRSGSWSTAEENLVPVIE